MSKKRQEKKDEFISVRVEKATKERLLEIAEETERPLSWIVGKILRAYVAVNCQKKHCNEHTVPDPTVVFTNCTK